MSELLVRWLWNEKKRWQNAFKISFFSSFWMLVFGYLLVSSMEFIYLKPNIWQWPFPIGNKIDIRSVLVLFFGTVTLTGLTVTIANIQEYIAGRAMTFEDALILAGKFIDDAWSQDYYIRYCSYYPALGTITKNEFPNIYHKFYDKIRNKSYDKIQLLTLKYMAFEKEDNNIIKTINIGERPDSWECTIENFIEKYFPNNETNKDSILKEALEQNQGIITPSNNESWKTVDCVPDYHFMIAGPNKKVWNSAIIIMPLIAPGVIEGKSIVFDHNIPPFLGIKIFDKKIINSLNLIFEALWDNKLLRRK